MILVKLVGGAKKSFGTDNLQIEESDISIKYLLDLLLQLKPKDNPKLDIENILVAVNGIDSSAMEGKITKIKNGDTVSIIPIIHGGSENRMSFNISKKLIQIIEINSPEKMNELFIDSLRKKYPQIKLQAISSNFILSICHLKKILLLSVTAEKNKVLLSNKFEIDLLMRFALTSQISDAIKIAGIKPKQNFIVISLGNKKKLDSLYTELKSDSVKLFLTDNNLFIKKYFKISDKHLNAVLSKNSLEDILVEKAAILL